MVLQEVLFCVTVRPWDFFLLLVCVGVLFVSDDFSFVWRLERMKCHGEKSVRTPADHHGDEFFQCEHSAREGVAKFLTLRNGGFYVVVRSTSAACVPSEVYLIHCFAGMDTQALITSFPSGKNLWDYGRVTMTPPDVDAFSWGPKVSHYLRPNLLWACCGSLDGMQVTQFLF